MKETAFTGLICKGHCRYYKEGKEELHCGGYSFLREHLTPSELSSQLAVSGKAETAGEDREFLDALCKNCDFFVDGCDFAENRSGPPCGGYAIVRIISSR
ncbi:MAG: hypothetical protein WC291_06335 [Thermodesulfovibrionales bacterium]|jgi:hypothetical protein